MAEKKTPPYYLLSTFAERAKAREQQPDDATDGKAVEAAEVEDKAVSKATTKTTKRKS